MGDGQAPRSRTLRLKGSTPSADFTFADVFAGCGGLSLGLTSAGWRGRFAIEKNKDAFATLSANLIDAGDAGFGRFSWPQGIPRKAMSTRTLLSKYQRFLKRLDGKITLLAGGPPCQGFSLAGRRTQADPRNSLTDDYIRIVKLVKPRFLLIENVRGFTMSFIKNPKAESGSTPYSDRVRQRLQKMGYTVHSGLIDLSAFGVPQIRKRFILLAIKSGDRAEQKLNGQCPLKLLRKTCAEFRTNHGLPARGAISARQAIGDLEVAGRKLVECPDSPYKDYYQVSYHDTKYRSGFISLMRTGATNVPNSMRLPKHKPATESRFERIIATCIAGRTLSDTDRKRLRINKHAITLLKPSAPAATVTTLPDDMIHYAEPRILTARENARLQTFPDTYEFHGHYTTGGSSRKSSCPRYTQIGNAVPPLFAKAVGLFLADLAR